MFLRSLLCDQRGFIIKIALKVGRQKLKAMGIATGGIFMHLYIFAKM